jgi:hypothetical protein
VSSLSGMGGREDRFAALERELRSEQANTLGRLGRAVQESIEALERAPANDARARTQLVDEAAYAVWCYFVFREALGLHHHQQAIEVYRIPGEVIARVGAVRAAP